MYQPVDFGGDATRTLDLSDGRTVAIANNPAALGGAYMRDLTAHPQAEQEPTLAPSWLDKFPVAHESRQFLFHYTTHNFEAALGDFAKLSVELGTANVGGSYLAARSFATKAGEAIFFSGGKGAAFELATQAAESEGGRLITDTVGGQVLKVIAPRGSASVWRDTIWNWGSSKFAGGAHGAARAFIRSPLRPSNTWETVEYPILRVNPFVRVVPR